MASYTSIINPGLVNAEGEHKYLNQLFTKGVSMGISVNSFLVSQRAAGANMSVDIAVGNGNFELPTLAYSVWGWTDAVTNLAIATANATNPRVDSVVAWIDTTVTTTGSANNPGSLKFSSIAGTPSASPVAVSDSAIQSTLGANIAFIRLAYVYVGAGVTSITSATDARTAIVSKVNALNVNPSPWLSWTPTFSNISIGNGASVAQYTQVGKTVTATLSLTFGSTTTINGQLIFSLPVPAAARYSGSGAGLVFIGVSYIEKLNTSAYDGRFRIQSNTSASLMYNIAGGTNQPTGLVTANATGPMTWGNGDFFTGTFTYEAA